jgi:hypothetical protein
MGGREKSMAGHENVTGVHESVAGQNFQISVFPVHFERAHFLVISMNSKSDELQASLK